VLGISVDSHACHKAFAEKLGVTFPLLSDLKREVSHLYGVYLEDKGICSRTTVIVDKDGIIRYQSTNDLSFRRDEKELLRVLKHINH
jgi:peroxiredoxin (alkyl hydroperoxide reductase subunit C)